YNAKRDCKNGDCVVKRIQRFREILSDKSQRPADRQEALKFLVHLVADMHQPLHCAERRDRNGIPDRAGNECKVYFLDDPAETNLHKVWDTTLLVRNVGTTSLNDYAVQLNSRITAEQQTTWGTGPLRVWANESNKVAIEHAYAGVSPDGPAKRLDQTYV